MFDLVESDPVRIDLVTLCRTHSDECISKCVTLNSLCSHDKHFTDCSMETEVWLYICMTPAALFS